MVEMRIKADQRGRRGEANKPSIRNTLTTLGAQNSTHNSTQEQQPSVAPTHLSMFVSSAPGITLASWLRVDTARARRSGEGAPISASTRGTCEKAGQLGLTCESDQCA